MDDQEVIDRINALANEEHQLYQRESEGTLNTAERERLQELEVALDQCYDLLRRRRARRAAGLDPDEVELPEERIAEGTVG